MKSIILTAALSLFLTPYASAAYTNDAHFAATNIDAWHDAGYTGAGVKIVVIDRGSVEIDHPLFGGSLTDVDGSMAAHNVSSHAQDTAQVLHEVAPNADIRLVDEDRSGFYGGISYAIAEDAQIVSRSMTIHPEAVGDPINRQAYEAGVLLNGASGNFGSTILPYASSPYWLTTGAATLENGVPVRTAYSSYGAGIDVMGLSANIVRIDLDDPASVQYYHGTSSATPYISGMIALYYEYFDDQHGRFPTVDEAHEFIAENTRDLESPGYDEFTGHGLFVLPELDEKCASVNPAAVVMVRPDGAERIVHRDYVEEYIEEENYRVKCGR